jgi:hypothetical protein
MCGGEFELTRGEYPKLNPLMVSAITYFGFLPPKESGHSIAAQMLRDPMATGRKRLPEIAAGQRIRDSVTASGNEAQYILI